MARQRLVNCGKCGTEKILLRSGASRCLVCHNLWGKEYYRKSASRRRKQRESYVFRKYRLSIEALEAVLARQGGRCAICFKYWQECTSAKRAIHDDDLFLQYLYVDHDHRTGAVRGLLCNACNTAIGLFEENRTRLIAALRYLNRNA